MLAPINPSSSSGFRPRLIENVSLCHPFLHSAGSVQQQRAPCTFLGRRCPCLPSGPPSSLTSGGVRLDHPRTHFNRERQINVRASHTLHVCFGGLPGCPEVPCHLTCIQRVSQRVLPSPTVSPVAQTASLFVKGRKFVRAIHLLRIMGVSPWRISLQEGVCQEW